MRRRVRRFDAAGGVDDDGDGLDGGHGGDGVADEVGEARGVDQVDEVLVEGRSGRAAAARECLWCFSSSV